MSAPAIPSFDEFVQKQPAIPTFEEFSKGPQQASAKTEPSGVLAKAGDFAGRALSSFGSAINPINVISSVVNPVDSFKAGFAQPPKVAPQPEPTGFIAKVRNAMGGTPANKALIEQQNQDVNQHIPELIGNAAALMLLHKAPEVARGIGEGYGKVFPSKETLGKNFQQINAAVGKQPVDVSKFAQPAIQARHLNRVTGDTNPTVLRKAFGAIQPTTEPLTFEDSRLLQSSAGRRAVQMAETPKVVSKPMAGHVAQLAKGLGEANSEVAAKGGVGPLYESTMKGYGRRQGLEATGRVLKKAAIPLAIGAVGAGVAKPLINSLISQ